MFCQKCGKEITDDAVFCPACGNSVSNGTQTGTGQAKISKEGKLHARSVSRLIFLLLQNRV